MATKGPYLIAVSYDMSISASDLSIDINSPITPIKFTIQNAQGNRVIPLSDTRFLVASNPFVYLFDRTGKVTKAIHTYQGHQSNVTDLCVTGNYMYTCSEDKTFQRWEINKQRPNKTVNAQCCLNTISLISGDKYIATGNDRGQIEIWDPDTMENLLTNKIAPVAIRSISESKPSGIIIAGTHDGNVYELSLTSTDEDLKLDVIRKIKAHTHVITRVATSSDGKYFATTSADSTGAVWLIETGELWMRLEDKSQTRWVWDVCFSPDSTYVITGGTDKICRKWDLVEKTLARQYEWHQKGITCLTIMN